MRKFIILIIVYSSIVFNVLSQNETISVIYKKKSFPVDISKIKDPNVVNRVRSIEASFSDIEYILIATKNESTFNYIQRMDKDIKSIPSRAITSGGMEGSYYTNLKTKSRQLMIESFDKTFIIDEPFVKYNWKITKEKKSINNYECIKASSLVYVDDITGKYNYEVSVWFAPELPYNFGPASYFGDLPGLVLEVNYDNKIIIYAKKINLNSNIKIKKNFKGEQIAREEYNKVMSEMIEKIKNGSF